MKCFKVTVFEYFQKLVIYTTPNASFLVWNAPNSLAHAGGAYSAPPDPLAGFG